MNQSIFLVFFVCLVSCFGVGVPEGNAFEAPSRNDFEKFFDANLVGRILKNLAKELDVSNALSDKRVSEDEWPRSRVNLFCITCAKGVDEILQLNYTEAIVIRTIELCIELGLASDYVCDGIIRANEPVVLWIVENTPDTSGKDICGFVFSDHGCESDNPARIWKVAMPNVTKPPIDEPPYAESGLPTLKVLHLSDTHYDPRYTPGMNVFCAEEYLCCRIENGIPDDPNNAAGFWGDYRNCDLPKWTLEAIYEHIATNNPDIDFIIYTGDLVPHDVWNQTRESSLAILHELADLLVKYFPGVPVYPAVGNHDTDTVNLFPQPYIDEPEFDISWLYDELSLIWQTWLPADAANSVAYAAYYSVQIRTGLRIVSVNTNYCHDQNWWLVYDSSDIADQLSLLAQELQNAEDVGDRVYIIGHISSGSGGCTATWAHQFNLIVARYENTVVGIFYGHSHHDEFQLYFDPEDPDRVYEVAYFGQSQTSYTDVNPGYKIYTIEGEFEGSRFRVLDHENYVFDLSVANAINQTTIFKLYSAKEEYGLTDLSPQSWLDLIFQMNEPNNTLFDAFYRNYVKAGTPSMLSGCDEGCKHGLLCGLLISDSGDNSQCDKLN